MTTRISLHFCVDVFIFVVCNDVCKTEIIMKSVGDYIKEGVSVHKARLLAYNDQLAFKNYRIVRDKSRPSPQCCALFLNDQQVSRWGTIKSSWQYAQKLGIVS